MLIGLLADTHIPREAKALPPQVALVLKGVDLILHAGDIYSQAVLDELEQIAPVLAARGNGDVGFPPDWRVRENHLLHFQGLRLGLTHGVEVPEPPYYPLERAMARCFGGPVDILVFGDTHVELVEEHKGVFLVNPGSPTLPHGLHRLGTVGLLRLDHGHPQAQILQL